MEFIGVGEGHIHEHTRTHRHAGMHTMVSSGASSPWAFHSASAHLEGPPSAKGIKQRVLWSLCVLPGAVGRWARKPGAGGQHFPVNTPKRCQGSSRHL